MREMKRTDTRARYNRDELYLLTDLFVQLDFVYVYILFFFIHYYSKAFIFYTTSTIDSSLFSNTVRVIIALKRSKPIYKTNCSDGHRPLLICVCTRTDHLKYSIIPWMCSRHVIFIFINCINWIILRVPQDFGTRKSYYVYLGMWNTWGISRS